jgi:8-amino-7-oxononanoate synthase
MADDPYAWIEKDLHTLHRAGWYRSVRTSHTQAGPWLESSTAPRKLNLGSNDYLGLTVDERVREAAIQAIQRYGTGATGSRLLSGHLEIHQELEQALAQFKGTEDALVFPSGYMANLGTISALVGSRDLLLGDVYNHSSLKSGAKLSGARYYEYAHGSVEHLEALLNQERAQARRCLICTDSVFSMDGDMAPLAAILDLAQRFEAMVLVDEAHGTGVLGVRGAGAIEALGLQQHPCIQMGTLSKALASQGGYVCGSKSLVDFLRNRAPTWIYTTALAPGDAAAALAALRIVQTEPHHREQLWQRVQQVKQGLTTLAALELFASDSCILCLKTGTISQTMNLSNQLWERGFWVPAIRPPTVPTSRLRISMMSNHPKAALENFVTYLLQVFSLEPR